MSEVSVRLHAMTAKLVKVNQRLTKLRSENESLRNKVNQLEVQLKSEQDQNRILQADYNKIKLAKNLAISAKDKAEMKFRVNELVREIDKCIAILNR
jgi:chromosome segregation ATPase